LVAVPGRQSGWRRELASPTADPVPPVGPARPRDHADLAPHGLICPPHMARYSRGETVIRKQLRAAGLVGAAIALVAAAACSSNSGGEDPSSSPDDGSTLTLWTRAGTEAVSRAYAEAYNATHQNQVEVTAYPNEEYPAKVASAAGARALPDLFASDVVFAPQYASQGLWMDITDKFNALPVKDKVAPAHVRNGTWKQHVYAVPHTIDMSVM